MYENLKKFIPSPVKKVLKDAYGKVEQKYKMGEKNVTIEGINAKFNIKNQKDIYRLNTDFEGQYAKEIVKSFKKIGESGTVVNIGAAQGFYVVFSGLSKNKVIAIEPDPETFVALNNNLDLNNLNSNVECLNYAIGDKDGKEVLFTSGAGGPAPKINEPNGYEQSIEVPVFRLDTVLKQNPDIAIIDVEGYEGKVINGMGDLRPKEIFIELHPKDLKKMGTSEDDLLNQLFNYGYELKKQYTRGNEFHYHLVFNEKFIEN